MVGLNQPTPPLERRRVIVQRQQLKRLENCAHRDDSRLTMKSQLIAIVAAVLVVGCGESQQSASAPEAKTEPPTAKAPDISIHDAAKNGNIEAVKQHLAAGTDVNATGEDGWPALHCAARRGHKEIAELLIDNDTEVNAKDEYGQTPLSHAAWEGHTEVVELLIAKGADVNANTASDYTPLHGAALAAHPADLVAHKEVIELLIVAGADVNAKDEDGRTPLDKAIERNRNELADLLRKHGGKTGEELKAEGK
ncbi:MAG TPA: ankyrin repeat domain-containing protein [Dehalococcoidia bacterium]|nr:ankyrin repeat domain-containing protein [Dehalococcoidia bacterium]